MEIATEKLAEFLFSLRFYEFSAHHHEEVERMAGEFGIDLELLKPFLEQQKLSYKVQLLEREISEAKHSNDKIKKIIAIIRD